MATVSVTRVKQYFGLIRSMEIFIDDRPVGSVRNGETATFEVREGMHRIHCQMDWWRSPPAKFEVLEDGAERFRCGTVVEGKNYAWLPWYMTFGAGEAMFMEQF